MLSVVPASVMLMGIFGMLVLAFAVGRMTMLERKVQRPATIGPSHRSYAGSGV